MNRFVLMSTFFSMRSIFLFAVLCTAAACQSPQTSDELKQAGEIHLQALALSAQLENSLDSLGQTTTVPPDSLAAWKRELEAWEENLVEVPGLGHEHDHDHEGHDHHHEAAPNITDADMLKVQKEALRQLQALQIRIPDNR
jgi:ABC-type nickel/cobalt efflux system permease component RcnA